MADLTPRFLVYNPTNNHLLRVLVADFLRTHGFCLTSLQARRWLDSECQRIVSPYRRRPPRSPTTLFNNLVKLCKTL